MPVPARKSPPQTVTYRGAKYELVKTPPREVTYRGARYVLAVEQETPHEEKMQLQKIEVDVPSIVFAYNYMPVIKAFTDPLVRLTTILDEAYKKGMWQKMGGLKKIIDAGYDEKLAALLFDPVSGGAYAVDVMDGFLDSFAHLHATADTISKVVDNARKEVLATKEFKELLDSAGDDAYNRLYNSALTRLERERPDMRFVIKQRELAAKKAKEAEEALKKSNDVRVKDNTTSDGKVKTEVKRRAKKP